MKAAARQAIPILRKSAAQTGDKDLKRQVGFDGVRCAMSENQPDAAVEFLRFLNREFPHDPDVLYVSVHTYSDLSTWAAQELAATAPNSYQAHELNAEALELQGKWDEAAKEYKPSCNRTRVCPGSISCWRACCFPSRIHSPQWRKKRKKELQQEIEIDPTNAGAEYVLGELARQDSQWPEAIAHFTRATKLDATFGDAYFGLGVSLISIQTISGSGPAARDSGQAGAEKPGRALQFGHGLQSLGTQTGRGEGICHPSPDDGEETALSRVRRPGLSLKIPTSASVIPSAARAAPAVRASRGTATCGKSSAPVRGLSIHRGPSTARLLREAKQSLRSG